MTNAIRPVVVASLLAKGEAQMTHWSPMGTWPAQGVGSPVSWRSETGPDTPDDEGWLATEGPDGVGHETRRPAWTGRLGSRHAGVRASIVAWKPGNAGGAKGRRKMEA
jgi:hypothetical protein